MTISRPLVPKTAGTAAAAGGIGASLLAALGYLGTSLLEMHDQGILLHERMEQMERQIRVLEQKVDDLEDIK